MRKQRFGPAIGFIIGMSALIAAYVGVACYTSQPDPDKICQGVTIDGMDVSGKTKDEAEKKIQSKLDSLASKSLEVDVNGKKVTATLEKLGYKCESGDVVEQALKLGKTGNIFSNYKEVRDLQLRHRNFSVAFTYSEAKVKKFVEKTCGKKCTKAKNSQIKMKQGSLVYTKEKQGVTLDVKKTTEKIHEALQKLNAEENNVIRVTAVVAVEQPKVTEETARRCKDKIGSFSTQYNAGNISRSKNVANAARLINGTVIYPGETFSVHDAISPMTEDNGYYAAPSYSNGQVVDSIGGGVCQVSTTLYNAVLRAELKVVQRSPHSMVVAYVSPSMDAAIAGDYKDLKFRNNTEVPIYIQGEAYDGTIYFNIYGEETRSSDRTVTFQSETTETMEPGADKVTYDKTKPSSYVSVTQEAHTGCKAVLWKIVTENGETKKTQVNSSTYKAEPRYVTKGAADATPAPSDKDKDKDKEQKAADKAKKTAKPTATPKAKETAAPTKAPENTEKAQTTAEPEE